MENFECLCAGFERNQDGAYVMATVMATSGNICAVSSLLLREDL